MSKTFIIANWKSNKTGFETQDFLESFAGSYKANPGRLVVICPPYLSVPKLSEFVKQNMLEIEIGIQDVSAFPEGAYTGEVSAKQAKEFATFSIIGHSERRHNFGEDDSLLANKVKMALNENIVPIFCVQGADTRIPEGVELVAYEPIGAIGTGNPDNPQDADAVAAKIKETNPNVKDVLYGGSVTPENVSEFVNMPNISGVLVGGASLDASIFSSLIEKCQKNQ